MTENKLEELKPEQIDAVKDKVIELFGEEMVKGVDRMFLMFQAMRLGAKDPYEFLKKAAEEDPENAEKIVAALLYGMRLGEDTAAFMLNKKHAEELEKAQAMQAQAEPQDGAVIAPHTTFVPGRSM